MIDVIIDDLVIDMIVIIDVIIEGAIFFKEVSKYIKSRGTHADAC